MEPIPDEQYAIEFNSYADNYDNKKEILKHFLQEDTIDYQDGINSNKFLYLYGPANTGKLAILKEVALEIFGDQWERRIYLRQDDGQRYPYKLHAHKVEYSRKVILLTDKRAHWRKWRELYPTTKTFRFEGAEVIPNTNITIRWTDYFTQNTTNNLVFKTEIDTMISSFFQEHNLSETLSNQLRNTIKNRIIEHYRSNLELLQSSEVSNALH